MLPSWFNLVLFGLTKRLTCLTREFLDTIKKKKN